jgi:hypothetical protein
MELSSCEFWTGLRATSSGEPDCHPLLAAGFLFAMQVFCNPAPFRKHFGLWRLAVRAGRGGGRRLSGFSNHPATIRTWRAFQCMATFVRRSTPVVVDARLIPASAGVHMERDAKVPLNLIESTVAIAIRWREPSRGLPCQASYRMLRTMRGARFSRRASSSAADGPPITIPRRRREDQ